MEKKEGREKEMNGSTENEQKETERVMRERERESNFSKRDKALRLEKLAFAFHSHSEARY